MRRNLLTNKKIKPLLEFTKSKLGVGKVGPPAYSSSGLTGKLCQLLVF
jgi:hypothetical protein